MTLVIDEALRCYEHAYQELLPYKDQDAEAIAGVLSNTAVCLIVLNDFSRALSTYQRAREFCKEHNMPLLVVQADYNIAYLYYLRGEYSRALQMMDAAREAAKKVGDLYHAALCDVDQSEIFLELNLFEEAAEVAQQAFDKFERLGTDYEAAKSLANLAFALSHQGMVSRALRLFQLARELFVREKNQVWPSLIDLYRALVLFNEGRLFESRQLCSRALSFFNSSVLPGKAVLCHLLLARLSLQVADLKTARRKCEHALARLARLGAPVLTYQAHFLMGQVEGTFGNRQAAAENYQKARDALETLRSNLQGDDLKIAFMQNKLAVYEELVQGCLNRKSDPAAIEKAFGYMEQAKSRSLRDLIFRPVHTLPALQSGEHELLSRVRGLREELNWYYHRMHLEELTQRDRSPKRIEHLQAETRSREKRLLEVLRELPPPEAALLSAAPLSLEAVRAELPPDAALVEYYQVRDRFLVCVITGETMELVSLTDVPRVTKLIRMLQFQLAKFRLGADYGGQFSGRDARRNSDSP